ncbi:MAG: hypothetical protein ISS48_02375 [Candidatus Aenigmarchaeota archaeon]|nr:hypothetical protein [Candidatus Aenigmarchaeota archaeon]
MPIDIVPLHLLGSLLPDFSLLVVDEFAKFNSYDGMEEVSRLEEILDRLDTIYGRTKRIRCSDFMGSSEYRTTLEKIKPVIEENEEMGNLARKTVPSKYRRQDNFLDYPINEVACVTHLYSNGFRLKLGPERERKYDKLMRTLNENGRYGLRDFLKGMEFGYTSPVFSLSGREVVPYIPSQRHDRILLGDTEQQVIDKLFRADEKALRYLATIGSVASAVLGRDCNPRNAQFLEGDELLDMTTDVLINGIIKSYQKTRGD